MNLARLRLITFDVTDTLLKFRNAPGMQYGEIGAMYGILADNNSLAANFKRHWYKMNKEHPNFGLKSGVGWENWWKMVVFGTFKDSKYNVEDSKLDAIALHLLETYKTSACWQQCFGAVDLLSFLKSKNIPLGIISNFDPRLSVTLENTKLREFFNFVITSYEAGFEKPDSKIFELAMKEASLKDLKPEECLHVGDTALLDYYGALNCNWNAALIHERAPEKLQEKYPRIQPNTVFSNLYEMHKHLKKST